MIVTVAPGPCGRDDTRRARSRADHLLRCYRYIELNPVRAAMVTAPADYRWSSYCANALGHVASLLTPHPQYLALGRDASARLEAYKSWVADAIPAEELELIRLRLQRQHVLGNDRLTAMIEEQLQRRAGPGRIGRPGNKARAMRESAL